MTPYITVQKCITTPYVTICMPVPACLCRTCLFICAQSYAEAGIVIPFFKFSITFGFAFDNMFCHVLCKTFIYHSMHMFSTASLSKRVAEKGHRTAVWAPTVALLKSETRMTASILKQDPNTEMVQKNAIFGEKTQHANFQGNRV